MIEELEGTWPKNDLRRAFVDGAKWWQYKANGSTAFPAEVDEMAQEAERRYEGVVPGDAAAAAPRPCTCHPDDNPPRPCPQKFAITECRKAAAGVVPSEATPVVWQCKRGLAVEYVYDADSAERAANPTGIGPYGPRNAWKVTPLYARPTTAENAAAAACLEIIELQKEKSRLERELAEMKDILASYRGTYTLAKERAEKAEAENRELREACQAALDWYGPRYGEGIIGKQLRAALKGKA